MDVLLDEEEFAIRSAARAFLEGECPTSLVREMERDPIGMAPKLWAEMAELGWIGASLPVEVGGQGLSLTFTGLLLQEVGRHLAPVPLHSTVVAALIVAKYGTRELQQSLLPAVARGEAIATFALQDETGSIASMSSRGIAARTDGDDYILSGTRSFVDNYTMSDWLLVPCRNDDGAVFLIVVDCNAPGLTSVGLVTTAKDKQSKLYFDDVRVPAERIVGPVSVAGAPSDVVRDLFDHAVALLCAQIAGATRKDVELAVAYSKDRYAFGRPIGSFQSIQHMCADMLIWADGAELLASEAIWRLGAGLPGSVEASQAKAFTDRCLAACRSSQQIHGGIGFMMEFDLQLWYRRVAAWSLRLGSSYEHRARVAAALFDTDRNRGKKLRLGDTLVAVD
jgi:alkylation response protein AidB-like acyl-CoA dehydrogenase